MKIFRIYTEYKNPDFIKRLLSISFDGFTVLRGAGCYEGKTEKAVIIEILTNNKTLIKAIAGKIKERNRQKSVLITENEVNAKFI